MKAIIFKNLIKNIECNNDVIGEIHFSGKYLNYHISFYEDKNGNVLIEDFGRLVCGIWLKDTPNKTQSEIMTKIINDKHDELTRKIIVVDDYDVREEQGIFNNGY